MADISITAASVLASAQAAVRSDFNYGTGATPGQLMYLDASNLWQLMDNDNSAGAIITTLKGVSLNAGSAGQPASVCTSDPYFKIGGTLTKGTMVYGSNTAGGVTHSVPSSAQYPTSIGIPIDATYMNFKPMSAGVAV